MKNIVKNIVVTMFIITLAVNIAFAGGDKAGFFQAKMDNLAKAIIANDYQTMLSLYADDVYSMPSYEPMIIGKKTMAKKAMDKHDGGPKIKSISFSTVKVFGSKDQKVQIGKYNLTMMMPGQTEPMKDVGKFMSVWEKQKDSSWKIKAEIWNTDKNPMAMMGGDKKKK